MNTVFKLAAGAIAAAGALAGTAHAAGFMLTEQSAGSMGRAYAGAGVDGTDISGVYYNPATMVLHPGTMVQAGFVGIGLNLDYAGDEGDTENGRYKSQAIPHGYITHQVNDSMWVGLSLTVPFGMGTEYNDDWNHADRGISATILTFDFNPNFAWKITDKVSFGAGVSLQYASADLTIRQNIMKSSAGQAMASQPGVSGIVGQLDENGKAALYDGSVKSEIDADSWAWGWNVGVMWAPLDNLRFGLSYRSKIEHDAEGDLKISSPNQSLMQAINAISAVEGGAALVGQLSGMMGTMNGTATVSAPAWAMFSAAWDINDLLSLYATFRWADWSSFDELEIYGDGVKMATIENKWKDTYLTSVGADLRLTDWWTLRGGVAYETSPISKPENRTAIIPDADRWWFAVGSSFKLLDNLQWDISFAHLHGVHERNLYDTEGEKVGRFRKLDAYLLGTQLVYKF